jgi:hypothetical protein
MTWHHAPPTLIAIGFGAGIETSVDKNRAPTPSTSTSTIPDSFVCKPDIAYPAAIVDPELSAGLAGFPVAFPAFLIVR